MFIIIIIKKRYLKQVGVMQKKQTSVFTLSTQRSQPLNQSNKTSAQNNLNNSQKSMFVSNQGQKEPAVQIERKKLFKQNGLYNLIQLKTHLQDEGILDLKSMQDLIVKFTTIISNQPNLIKLNGNVVIIGDIHGQYYDFLKVLTKIKDAQENLQGNILFLGDYVDRGANSVEVITFIMALKVNYPKNVLLLRGNHESRCMTNSYNFMKQVLMKYNQNIYEHFMDAFDALPLACLVNKSFFCVHGGISNKLNNIQKLNEIDRFKQIPLDGAFCDLIWSDPIPNQKGYMNQISCYNESRQCSIYFGKQLTKKFVQENNIRSIIRAHQVFPEGYQRYCWDTSKNNEFPSVITVFSAPNYCGVYGNKGAIIKIEGTNFQIKQFKQQSINNKIHSYLEVFQWSVPEIMRVVNQFTKAMMTTIFQLYLKQQFANFKTASHYDRLKVMLQYIKKHTDILQRQQNQIFQSSILKISTLNKNIAHHEGQQKQRMFDRSRQYFKKQHGRPGGEDSIIRH